MDKIQRNRETSKRLQKKYREENPDEYYKKLTLRVRKWRQENPEKRIAHRVVFVELRAGRLQKTPCEVCGEIKSEAHHEDYSKPTQVRWYCKKHHRMADRGELSTDGSLTPSKHGSKIEKD